MEKDLYGGKQFKKIMGWEMGAGIHKTANWIVERR